MKKLKLVMIGNGMAGVRSLEELLKIAPELYEITVFGAEPHPNYNRILLSPVLAGEQKLEDIVLNDWAWYRDNGITLHAGYMVTEVDRVKRTVHATNAKGETLSADYDRLILATGSNPFILPVPGKDLKGVLAYRDIADTQAMIDAAVLYKHAVVIGGGLLGLEAANGLLRRGMDVTVVHLTQSLLNQQLDVDASLLLKSALERRGLRILLGAQTEAILGEGKVQGVRFTDGLEVPADLVVMAAGVRPNVALARSAGLHVERAIVVDDTLQSYDPRVYAVGECVQHRKATFGLVAPIWDQARVCAAHLAGLGHRRYVQQATATKLKVTGIDLYSAGDIVGGPGTQDLVLRDRRAGVYKRLVLEGSRITGAVLYGDVLDGPWYFDLIQRGADISALRDRLLFGPAMCEEAQAA